MWGSFLSPKSNLVFKELMCDETVHRHFISTVLDILNFPEMNIPTITWCISCGMKRVGSIRINLRYILLS